MPRVSAKDAAKTKKAPASKAKEAAKPAKKASKTASKPTKSASDKKKAAPAQKAAPKTTKKPASSAKKAASAPKPLEVGMKAPAFKLPATLEGEVSSRKLRGQVYVLYFYPKDNTSGCTAEACSFRDMLPHFDKLGLKVIGVSKDSLETHEKFAKKFDLSFPLACDEDGKICEAYGVWVEKSMYGRKYMGFDRSTFLIDGKGVIRAIWRRVSVPGHAEQVRKAYLAL